MQTGLQEMYANSGEKVRSTFADLQTARPHYAKYLRYVSRFVPRGSRILDVGCGNGWSSYLLAETGYTVCGIDLNANAFEPPAHSDLQLQEGSVLSLPFSDQSFDAVASYQCLEHVPDPERALIEIKRVLRPKGIVTFVGPNLLSLGSPIRGMFYHSWRGPLRSAFVRFADTPRHPPGNTVPENVKELILTSLTLLRLSLSSGFEYRMREPDQRPPFHGDNDSCWRTNSIEMSRALMSLNFEILAKYDGSRLGALSHLASGMYIAARLRGE